MTIQHLEGFALGVGLCFAYGIYYRRKVVVPLLNIVEELAPWYETKRLQDEQDAFLASLKPNEMKGLCSICGEVNNHLNGCPRES